MDYAITQENDTIYGLIRESGINNIALFTKNTNPDLDGIKFYSNNLKKVKEIRWNDAIYIFQESSKEDGIYSSPVNHNKKGFITKIQGNFINHSPRLKDYIISENDTIYGVINDRRMGKAVLKDDSNNKIKIDIENIKSYRHNNEVFVVKEKKRVELFDDKIAYLKILLDGPIKYYEYMTVSRNSADGEFTPAIFYYFIENNDVLSQISPLNFKNKMRELLANDIEMLSKLNEGEYTFENIYHIIKFLNDKE